MLKFHSDHFTFLVPDGSESHHELSLISNVIGPEETGAVSSNLFITNRGQVEAVGLGLIIMQVVHGGEDRDVWHNDGGLDSHVVHISATLTEHPGHCCVCLYLCVLRRKVVAKSHSYCGCNPLNLLKTGVGYDATFVCGRYSLVELPLLLWVINDKRHL